MDHTRKETLKDLAQALGCQIGAGFVARSIFSLSAPDHPVNGLAPLGLNLALFVLAMVAVSLWRHRPRPEQSTATQIEEVTRW